jgi:hypothetical protein
LLSRVEIFTLVVEQLSNCFFTQNLWLINFEDWKRGVLLLSHLILIQRFLYLNNISLVSIHVNVYRKYLIIIVSDLYILVAVYDPSADVVMSLISLIVQSGVLLPMLSLDVLQFIQVQLFYYLIWILISCLLVLMAN